MFIHRECGGKILNDICLACYKTVSKTDRIASWTLKARMSQLKAMHTIMCNTNDEDIYATWIITGVPDEPSEDDYEYIAMDDELYNECFDLFVELVKDKGIRW